MRTIRNGSILAVAMLVLVTGWVVARGEQEHGSMESETMESESMESESMSTMSQSYTVTIDVLSDAPSPLAPVAWAIHSGANPFVAGDMGGTLSGLEALAEDGDPSGANAALAEMESVTNHGVANTPSGSSSPGPAVPGTSYSFEIEIAEGEHLSFATMYVQSNDLFYSPGEQGLAVIMDAGTEVNEEPGAGPNQAPRQSGPNTGQDEMGTVRPISAVDDGYRYPSVSEVIRVTVAEK